VVAPEAARLLEGLQRLPVAAAPAQGKTELRQRRHEEEGVADGPGGGGGILRQSDGLLLFADPVARLGPDEQTLLLLRVDR